MDKKTGFGQFWPERLVFDEKNWFPSIAGKNGLRRSWTENRVSTEKTSFWAQMGSFGLIWADLGSFGIMCVLVLLARFEPGTSSVKVTNDTV